MITGSNRENNGERERLGGNRENNEENKRTGSNREYNRESRIIAGSDKLVSLKPLH